MHRKSKKEKTSRPRRPGTTDPYVDGLISRAVASIKAEEFSVARRFLESATIVDPEDPRPYVWLASTTEDPAQKRRYLEKVLKLDPANMAARRGLAALDGHVPEEIQPHAAAPAAPSDPVAARARNFACPQCGGQLRYDPSGKHKRCERCGTTVAVEQYNASSDDHEQVLDHMLPNQRAHHWAAAEHALACQQCGASTVLPAGQRTTECAFCGSNQLVSSPHIEQLLEPQGIIPMRITEEQARQSALAWLATGTLVPADLPKMAQNLRLRPAYYPVWSFDCTFNVRWSTLGHSGEEVFSVDDLLIPGTRALPTDALREVEPFNIGGLVEFREAMLAGWPTLLYDRSLADASIEARGEMAHNAQRALVKQGIGKAGGRLRVIPDAHRDQTYRHLLLPMWSAHYQYGGQQYHLFVNGQTGKAGGTKPRAETQLAPLIGLVVTIMIVLFFVGLYWYLGM